MALIQCSECGSEISDKAAACIKCGAPIDTKATVNLGKTASSPAFDRPNTPPPTATATASHPTKPSTNLWMWIVGVPLGLFVALVLSSAIGNKGDAQADAKDKARELIKMCWKDQERKSLSPGSQRYVAGMCENFEEEFRQKFHATP